MNIGMLWLDNSQKPLAERVKQAAAYYKNKYGAEANLCFVNPSEKVVVENLEGITIRSSNQVLKFHLWMGRAEA